MRIAKRTETKEFRIWIVDYTLLTFLLVDDFNPLRISSSIHTYIYIVKFFIQNKAETLNSS